jgi:hypothetical protein
MPRCILIPNLPYHPIDTNTYHRPSTSRTPARASKLPHAKLRHHRTQSAPANRPRQCVTAQVDVGHLVSQGSHAKRGYRPDLRTVSVLLSNRIFLSIFCCSLVVFLDFLWSVPGPALSLEPAGTRLHGGMKVGRGHVCKINPSPSWSRSNSGWNTSPCRYRAPFVFAPRRIRHFGDNISSDSLYLLRFPFPVHCTFILSWRILTSSPSGCSWSCIRSPRCPKRT